MGFFGPAQDIMRVVIELKSPGADLDAKQSGYGNLTPVEQAFGYLAKFDDCRWVSLSNFTTLRLYSKRRRQVYAHAFNLADLANPEALRLFLFLLSRERLLGSSTQPSPVDALLEEACAQEQSITRDFYALFTQVRRELFDALCRDNPPPAATEPDEHRVRLLALTQKLLDRVLFVCFCEDTHLLPRGVLKQALEAASHTENSRKQGQAMSCPICASPPSRIPPRDKRHGKPWPGWSGARPRALTARRAYAQCVNSRVTN